jgi:hypothetical protein
MHLEPKSSETKYIVHVSTCNNRYRNVSQFVTWVEKIYTHILRNDKITNFVLAKVWNIYIPLSLVTVFSFPAQPNMHECLLLALAEC